MKIKTSKKITKLILIDEPMYDWAIVADFSLSYGDRLEDLSFKDAFYIGLLSEEESKPIFRINGKYGIYFFVGKELEIFNKIKKFME
jgi:hypothetical protein